MIRLSKCIILIDTKLSTVKDEVYVSTVSIALLLTLMNKYRFHKFFIKWYRIKSSGSMPIRQSGAHTSICKFKLYHKGMTEVLVCMLTTPKTFVEIRVSSITIPMIVRGGANRILSLVTSKADVI